MRLQKRTQILFDDAPPDSDVVLEDLDRRIPWLVLLERANDPVARLDRGDDVRYRLRVPASHRRRNDNDGLWGTPRADPPHG
jgi:hypothetical protein